MGVTRTVSRRVGEHIAPSVASQYVRGVLDKAIDGVGPLRSAAASADSKLVDAGGDVETAVSKLIRLHATLAGAQGFVTNLGGVAALAVALPANVIGVTLVQCHLIAGIAHLRGYDLEDPRVRNAILVCMLGE
ncbi:MAG TPA: EcsC family protein, partial [Aeromicrobium sp.]|nr:EcsC family protein [Aeromicrobium sp.]